MTAELICVGTELLMGQILNTNALYVSRQLAPCGIDMYYQQTVGDNPERLKAAIALALSRADVVLLSGGLGPTTDDLTKETAAEVLGYELVFFPEQWDIICGYFARLGRVPTDNNRKQAMFPVEGVILPNPNGTAPGCMMEKNGRQVYLLPGPPREFEPMMHDVVLPMLLKSSGHRLYSVELRVYGMGESELAGKISDLIANQTNPTIAPYAKTGEVTLRLTASCQSDEEGRALIAPVVEKIRLVTGDKLYSECGETLPMLCHRLLGEQGKTLSTAESLTGGLLSSAFVDNAGSSDYFLAGVVAYNERLKTELLGIPLELLQEYTAVSPETAKAMAVNVRRLTSSALALSTTGYAGPYDEQKGLAYVALADENEVAVRRLHLTGDRRAVREKVVLAALDMLRRRLAQSPK